VRIPNISVFLDGRWKTTALLPSTARNLVRRYGSTLDAAEAMNVPEWFIYNALPKETGAAMKGHSDE
jgi:hypothetical protein